MFMPFFLALTFFNSIYFVVFKKTINFATEKKNNNK